MMNDTRLRNYYLSLSYVFLIAIPLGLLGLIWLQYEERAIIQRFEAGMREQAELLAKMIERNGASDILTLELPERSLVGEFTALYVDGDSLVHNLQNRPVTGEMRAALSRIDRDLGFTEEARAYLSGGSEPEKSVYATAPVRSAGAGPTGKVYLILNPNYLNDYFNRLRLLMGGMIFIISVLGVVASLMVNRIVASRVTDTRRLAFTLTSGNYRMRLPESGPPQMKELSRTLNVMSEKLQQQEQTRRQILANVTHELARPLAALLLGVQSLRGGALRDQELASDLLHDMEHTVKQMESLVDDLSLAARPTSSPVSLDRKPLDVHPFLHELANQYAGRAAVRGVDVTVDVPAGLPQVFADEKRLHQIMSNLLDNAIKFTPRGRRILVSARTGGDRSVELIVKDGGSGIPEDESRHLFTPFFQGQKGRLIKQGMGLGLSIARQLAELHGGRLRLENHPDGGAVATVTIPVALD